MDSLMRIVATVSFSAAVAAIGTGVSAAVAQAYPMCTPQGTCATQWCPGRSLPEPDVVWDMTVCHDFTSHPYPGSVQVGEHIWEGNPCGPEGPFCFPRKVPS